MTNGEAKTNEHKVDIPFEVLNKISSINYKIPYTLVSLILHDGDYLDCVHCVSDIVGTNTRIWWYCYDDNITQISDLPKGVHIRENHQKNKDNKVISVSKDVLFVVYIRTRHVIKSSSVFFKNSPTCKKSII